MKVFLCRRTVNIDVESKAIPMSFLKIGGRRMIRTQVLKHLSGVGEVKRRGSKRDVK